MTAPKRTLEIMATIELDEAQVTQAVREYIERQGWEIPGTVEVKVRRGYDSTSCHPGEQSTPDTVAAKAVVKPKAPYIPGCYAQEK